MSPGVVAKLGTDSFLTKKEYTGKDLLITFGVGLATYGAVSFVANRLLSSSEQVDDSFDKNLTLNPDLAQVSSSKREITVTFESKPNIGRLIQDIQSLSKEQSKSLCVQCSYHETQTPSFDEKLKSILDKIPKLNLTITDFPVTQETKFSFKSLENKLHTLTISRSKSEAMSALFSENKQFLRSLNNVGLAHLVLNDFPLGSIGNHADDLYPLRDLEHLTLKLEYKQCASSDFLGAAKDTLNNIFGSSSEQRSHTLKFDLALGGLSKDTTLYLDFSSFPNIKPLLSDICKAFKETVDESKIQTKNRTEKETGPKLCVNGDLYEYPYNPSQPTKFTQVRGEIEKLTKQVRGASDELMKHVHSVNEAHQNILHRRDAVSYVCQIATTNRGYSIGDILQELATRSELLTTKSNKELRAANKKATEVANLSERVSVMARTVSIPPDFAESIHVNVESAQEIKKATEKALQDVLKLDKQTNEIALSVQKEASTFIEIFEATDLDD